MHPAAILLAASALAASGPADDGDRSLTDPGNAPLVAQLTAIPAPVLEEPRDRATEEQLRNLRATVKSLTDALALANSEAEVFKRQAEDASLRIEALGVPSAEGGNATLEGRLVAAVRDLRIAVERNEAMRAQLVRLVETVQLLIVGTSSIDPQLRANVEVELRKTNEMLGASPADQAPSVEPGLTDAMVIETKPELSLVIANVGRQQGVAVGMPFQVWRGARRIGEVRVVDVRDRISGSIIQSLENEKTPIKNGDRLRVDAKR
jgi:hypothetical protein